MKKYKYIIHTIYYLILGLLLLVKPSYASIISINVCLKSNGLIQHCYMEWYDNDAQHTIDTISYFVSRRTNIGFSREESYLGTTRNCKSVNTYDNITSAYNDWNNKVLSTYHNARPDYSAIHYNCCSVANLACIALGKSFPFNPITVNFGVGIYNYG